MSVGTELTFEHRPFAHRQPVGELEGPEMMVGEAQRLVSALNLKEQTDDLARY